MLGGLRRSLTSSDPSWAEPRLSGGSAASLTMAADRTIVTAPRRDA